MIRSLLAFAATVSASNTAIDHRHALHRHRPSLLSPVRLDARRFAQHLHTFLDPTERHVLPVQVGGSSQRHEELTPVRIRTPISHAQHSLGIVRQVEAFVAKDGRTVVRRRCRGSSAGAVESIEVTALYHESREDAMEFRSAICRNGARGRSSLVGTDGRFLRVANFGEVATRRGALVRTEKEHHRPRRGSRHRDAEVAAVHSKTTI